MHVRNSTTFPNKHHTPVVATNILSLTAVPVRTPRPKSGLMLLEERIFAPLNQEDCPRFRWSLVPHGMCSHSSRTPEETGHIHTGKEEVKLLVRVKDAIVRMRNPGDYAKAALELIREPIRVRDTRSMHSNQLHFYTLATSNVNI